jgi:hypothetical protein
MPVTQLLGPELSAFLACLLDQTGGTAEVALSALPDATLMRLVSLDVIKPVPTFSDIGFAIVITDQGQEVIRECARLRPAHEQTTEFSAAMAKLSRERSEGKKK